MNIAERREWVRRGFQDPRKAYLAHAAAAAQRGVAFRLTFGQWWLLWEPHYEQRGKGAGQMVMCRTGDAGAYEVGNVRIDTVKANGEERGRVHRAANLAAGRLPSARYRQPLATQAPDDWMRRRHLAFLPYDESDEDVGRA